MADSVDNIIASAKAAVNHADETERLNRPAPVPVPEGLAGKNAPAPTPKNDYSNTPYSMAGDAIKAIKARREAENAATQ